MELSPLENPSLDTVFGALADPTRRAILSRLKDGPASVSELAQPFDITQPAVSRHLKVLESAGLIQRTIKRQTRPAELAATPLKEAAQWLEDFRDHWDSRFDQLDQLLSELNPKET